VEREHEEWQQQQEATTGSAATAHTARGKVLGEVSRRLGKEFREAKKRQAGLAATAADAAAA